MLAAGWWDTEPRAVVLQPPSGHTGWSTRTGHLWSGDWLPVSGALSLCWESVGQEGGRGPPCMSDTSASGFSHDRARGWASEGLIGLSIVLKDRAWHWWDSARWGSQWLHGQQRAVGSAQPVVTLQGLGWESEQPCLRPGQLKPVGPLREVALLSVPLPTWQPCGEAWRRQTHALPDLSPAGTQQSGRQGDIPP